MHPDSINGWLIAFSELLRRTARVPGTPEHHSHGNGYFIDLQVFGHTTTNTTLNFYGHLLQKADAQSAECIANVLLYWMGNNQIMKNECDIIDSKATVPAYIMERGHRTVPAAGNPCG